MARRSIPRRTSRRDRVKWADVLAAQIAVLHPDLDARMHREFVFAPSGADGRPIRRWRFDLAFPAPDARGGVAVEVDGGLLTGGRHGGAPSAVRDVEKRLAATVLGWRVLHVMPSQVRSGEAVKWIEAAFGLAEPPLELRSSTWEGVARRLGVAG